MHILGLVLLLALGLNSDKHFETGDFYLGYPSLFASGQAFMSLLLLVKLARVLIPWLPLLPLLCWTVNCHVSWQNWCVQGRTLQLESLPLPLSEIPPRPRQGKGALTKPGLEFKCLSSLETLTFLKDTRNAEVQLVAGFGTRQIQFCSSLTTWLGARAGSLVPSLSNLIVIWSQKPCCSILPLGLDQSHLCPSWQMSLI